MSSIVNSKVIPFFCRETKTKWPFSKGPVFSIKKTQKPFYISLTVFPQIACCLKKNHVFLGIAQTLQVIYEQ